MKTARRAGSAFSGLRSRTEDVGQRTRRCRARGTRTDLCTYTHKNTHTSSCEGHSFIERTERWGARRRRGGGGRCRAGPVYNERGKEGEGKGFRRNNDENGQGEETQQRGATRQTQTRTCTHARTDVSLKRCLHTSEKSGGGEAVELNRLKLHRRNEETKTEEGTPGKTHEHVKGGNSQVARSPFL